MKTGDSAPAVMVDWAGRLAAAKRTEISSLGLSRIQTLRQTHVTPDLGLQLRL